MPNTKIRSGIFFFNSLKFKFGFYWKVMILFSVIKLTFVSEWHVALEYISVNCLFHIFFSLKINHYFSFLSAKKVFKITTDNYFMNRKKGEGKAMAKVRVKTIWWIIHFENSKFIIPAMIPLHFNVINGYRWNDFARQNP